ncbi:MAG: 3-oxoacyl-[acyl-carrier-protein] synthase, partial [Bacteroidota bacterium]|nr:3-oxoacyl-[acyl-carrier-protein] synthase [Bacteroidota bacterium]
NIPLVISSACIPGSMAIIHAARMIARGGYDNIIVSGGDIATEFVVSGFQSFQAISPEPCKPFDRDRKGLSIGEGCGTILLTCDNTNTGEFGKIAYLGGSISNDANHISGPSRTGEGQFIAIRNSMAEARITPADIDYISAHGTATPFNDEMEAKAFARSGLLEAPVNSLKGYIGHTLGAAGVIEAAAMLASMRNNFVYQSAGFENHGVEEPINIAGHGINKDLNICLKTASGFGGCNAAFIVGKE